MIAPKRLKFNRYCTGSLIDLLMSTSIVRVWSTCEHAEYVRPTEYIVNVMMQSVSKLQWVLNLRALLPVAVLQQKQSNTL
mmetsp:Transcript_30158/g.52218  ORF Transcript_30158/g.52218 Transcript_30158/m.52218 type:complete len:80 (-) Transcript_30158:4-243(-)